MGKFDSKVALITGAGRMRGIGRAAAIAFAREGAHVTITGTGPPILSTR
jgi:3-oxoacyl-[acyl-carrier protein] reductase/meso-butanediol dehydrogenase/(S,S)-butanediol dehydrogenase/diacetyl reductase